MEEWKKYKIGDIGKVITGKTPKTNVEKNYGGNIPFLTPSDDLSQKYAPKTAKTLTKLGLLEVKNCLLPPDSVCVSCIGSDLGKVVMLQRETVTNQQFNSIIPKKEYDPNFIYYIMNIIGRELNFLSKTSTAVPIINKSVFSNYTVHIPSLELQKQIADILSVLDDKIALNTRINDNLEQQAQALYKSWFVDFEPFKDRKFVDSEVGEIPKDWRVGTFSDIIFSTVSGDWGKDIEIGNHSQKVFCIRGADIPDIKTGNNGKMPLRYILSKNFENKALTNNDIVVEISGGSPTQSTGRVCRISNELLCKYDNALICTNFCKALKSQKNYSQYIYYCWADLYKKGIMFSYENGTTGIKNLDLSGLIEKEPILIPPHEIISEFSLNMDIINRQIIHNGIENEKLSILRDSLLPQLMSGEIKISDLNS